MHLRSKHIRSGAAPVVLAVTLVTALRLALLAVFPTNLMFDEAQYWTWAQHLSWGYYSKPPLIAWLIRASTALLGNSEWAVRATSPVLHGFAAISVYATARSLVANSRTLSIRRVERIARWACVIYLSSPGVTVGATMMTTDAPLLALWGWATYFVVRAVRSTHAGGRAIIIAGVLAGLGVLAKYTMLFAVPALAIFAAWPVQNVSRRTRFARAGIFGAITLTVMAPNIFWNLSHGLVTVAHTLHHTDGIGHAVHADRFVHFVGAQFGVFGPISMAMLITALPGFMRRGARDPRCRLIVYLTLPLLATMTLLSTLDHAWANWAAPAYVTGSIAVALVLVGSRAGVRWLRGATAFNVTAGLVIVALAASSMYSNAVVPSWLNLNIRKRGQRVLTRKILEVRQDYPGSVLLFDSRHIMAPVMYYMERDGHRVSAVKWDEDGHPDDYYEMHTHINDYIGRDFLLITGLPRVQTIAHRFEQTTRLRDIVVSSGTYHVYRCEHLHDASSPRHTQTGRRIAGGPHRGSTHAGALPGSRATSTTAWPSASSTADLP